MDPSQVTDLGRESLVLAISLAGPILGVALVVGIVIGIIQAATSVNEMTLSFIPKLGAVALALLVVGGWMIGLWVDFTERLFESIPELFR